MSGARWGLGRVQGRWGRGGRSGGTCNSLKAMPFF